MFSKFQDSTKISLLLNSTQMVLLYSHSNELTDTVEFLEQLTMKKTAEKEEFFK